MWFEGFCGGSRTHTPRTQPAVAGCQGHLRTGSSRENSEGQPEEFSGLSLVVILRCRQQPGSRTQGANLDLSLEVTRGNLIFSLFPCFSGFGPFGEHTVNASWIAVQVTQPWGYTRCHWCPQAANFPVGCARPGWYPLAGGGD